MQIFLIVIGFVLLILLVVVHELGHFLVARRNGVVAEEFGIFFPPRLFKRRIHSKRGDFDFTINLLPIGGFVKLKGENDADKRSGTFGAASLWAKVKIMAAGVLMNLIIGLVLLTILALTGLPKLIPNQFTVSSDTRTTSEVYAASIEPHSPAAKAGLTTGDKILAIGPTGHLTQLTDYSQLGKLTQKYAGQEVVLVYNQNGQKISKSLHLRSNQTVKGTKEGHLGVAVLPQTFSLSRSTWSAPVVAVGVSAQYTKLLFQGLGRAFSGLAGTVSNSISGNHQARVRDTNEARNQFVSIVGLYEIFKVTSQFGFSYILTIIAIISLTLAIINFLPIPAVDGRVWILLFSRLIKRPLSATVENALNATVFIIVLGLGILLIVSDVFKFYL